MTKRSEYNSQMALNFHVEGSVGTPQVSECYGEGGEQAERHGNQPGEDKSWGRSNTFVKQRASSQETYRGPSETAVV